MPTNLPHCSFVVPVHNEEAILASSISSLLKQLDSAFASGSSSYEVILCENGSTDSTLSIAQELANTHLNVRIEELPIASYGRALRYGIEAALGKIIIIVNADFWDVDFACQAVKRQLDYDVLIASKNAAGSEDRRPWHRRGITFCFNLLLKILFGYRGTDTHGLKALRAASIKPLAAMCSTDAEIFDTELVIRAQRAELRLLEVPIAVEEWRPSRYGLLGRVPRTIVDMIMLVRILGIRRYASSAEVGWQNRKGITAAKCD